MNTRILFREGMVAGLVGAAAVALWFLALDLINNHPMFTPAVLGATLFRSLGMDVASQGMALPVLAYSVFHVAMFVAIGVIATYATFALGRRPSMLVGTVVLLAVLEIGYLAATYLVASSELFGAYTWWQFGGANLVAAFFMGRYIWRSQHPARQWDWDKANDSHFHRTEA